jgi:hypothetical protein
VRDTLARRLVRYVLVEADSCARESEPGPSEFRR